MVTNLRTPGGAQMAQVVLYCLQRKLPLCVLKEFDQCICNNNRYYSFENNTKRLNKKWYSFNKIFHMWLALTVLRPHPVTPQLDMCGYN